jgi:antitoxin VapB
LWICVDYKRSKEVCDPVEDVSCIKLSSWHILMYMPSPRKAKIFMNNRSQAVRLPKEFQFKTEEVFIRKIGNDVVLSPKPSHWASYMVDGPVASETFMEGIEDLPVQERKS